MQQQNDAIPIIANVPSTVKSFADFYKLLQSLETDEQRDTVLKHADEQLAEYVYTFNKIQQLQKMLLATPILQKTQSKIKIMIGDNRSESMVCICIYTNALLQITNLFSSMKNTKTLTNFTRASVEISFPLSKLLQVKPQLEQIIYAKKAAPNAFFSPLTLQHKTPFDLNTDPSKTLINIKTLLMSKYALNIPGSSIEFTVHSAFSEPSQVCINISNSFTEVNVFFASCKDIICENASTLNLTTKVDKTIVKFPLNKIYAVEDWLEQQIVNERAKEVLLQRQFERFPWPGCGDYHC